MEPLAAFPWNGHEGAFDPLLYRRVEFVGPHRRRLALVGPAFRTEPRERREHLIGARFVRSWRAARKIAGFPFEPEVSIARRGCQQLERRSARVEDEGALGRRQQPRRELIDESRDRSRAILPVAIAAWRCSDPDCALELIAR